MRICSLSMLLGALLSFCSPKRVVITREYVINPYWNEEHDYDSYREHLYYLNHLGSLLEDSLLLLYSGNNSYDYFSESFNHLIVYRLRLVDSTWQVRTDSPSYEELFYRLVEDSCFHFWANILYNGESFRRRKIWFDKYNGFMWKSWQCDTSNRRIYRKTKIIGRLSLNSWYVFYGLGESGWFGAPIYFAYVDSLGNVRTFRMFKRTNF